MCSLSHRFLGAHRHTIPSNRQMPSATLRERAVGKESGKTNYIKRFNNMMRQRVGRLARKTLSFSKKLSNHIGAAWQFVRYYDACLNI